MKQTNINIDEIKRYPTVTYPILADDLHTPQAYAYTLRRAIVTDCNDRQCAELVKLLEGKDTAEGVTFQNTQKNRDRLHIWQNSESRKERAAILGEGWQYIEGLNHGTQPGDLITCIDGTRGRVTKSDPEICVIEFETENGQRLSVAGYFRKDRNYSASERLEADDERKAAERQERYEARCKELEAEALAQMPYKVGDTVTSRYGDTGRVIEMYPEITGDTDSPHLIYEYDGKPTVNVVILDTDGKRHCAHWSVFTLQSASEISDTEKAFNEALTINVGDKVLCKCYKTMGIVTGIRFNEDTKTYSYYVNYGKAVKGVNGNYTTGTYGRYGITKNYDQEGREIVGNYEYYRYEIRAGYMLDSDPREYELNGQRITAKMYGKDWRVTLHHSKGPDTTDTMTDHELATLLSRLYSAEKAA